MEVKLKKCCRCGKNPIIEKWAGGGIKYMVKCGNPDCGVPSEGYPSGHDLPKVVDEWNRRMSNETDRRG